MENEYSYYTTEQEEHYEEPKQEEKPKKNKGMSVWFKVIGFALVFGVVASAAFQTSNLLTDKILDKKGADHPGGNQTVESAKLSVGSGDAVKSDVAEIAKNAMPSVVSITNMSVQQVQSFFGGIEEQETQSAGSGIIISQNDEELLMVTNNHVVEGSKTLTVTFIDGESVKADMKGADASRDLAVIAVKLSDIKASTKEAISVAQMGDSSKLQVGEQAVAIGNALGYGQSVTTGIISATNRKLDGYDNDLIQTDAAINPGNSGGALLNANGEVIGINSAKVATNAVEGMGYAIPVSDVSDIITNLMNQKTKTKLDPEKQGYLGIQGVNVTEESAKMYNMPTGVYVSEVISGGGAKKAGITKGSVITKLEGTAIDSMTTLKDQLEYYAVGETVKVTVQVPQNNGEYQEKTVEVNLGKKG